MEKSAVNRINKSEGASFPVMKEEGEISISENHKKFMEGITARMQEANEQEIQGILTELERYSQSPDRKIEVYTDPELDTFCCGQVPSKIVNAKGKIIDDPNKKQYLIGVPFQYVAGKAEMNFLRGEILHEQGHARWTDFSRWKRFETLARQEGYDPQELLQLDNCIEDPRMERLVGGPMHENERKQLLSKNQSLIIPSIAEGIRGGEDRKKMTPTEQFKFIVKIERLWELHKKDFEGVEKPWSLNDLDPRTREEYEKIAPYLAQITGDSVKPAMKVNTEVEKIIVDHIWPAYKRLIEEFPEKQSKGSGKDGSGKSGKGQGKKGASSQTEQPPESENFDPADPSSWPPEMQKMFQKMIEKHNKRLNQEAEKVKEKTERQQKEEERLKSELHELQKTRDGFEDPETREKYNEIKAEVAAPVSQIKRIFDRFLPKVDEPQYNYGRKGIRFSVKNLVRRFGTGAEKPLGKRVTPEKNALVLHLLIDVSGSMYGEKSRIENAVKAAVAVCEAAEDHNIQIEILANDQDNVEIDAKYEIKKFNQSYSGQVKARLIRILDAKKAGFGGDNQDAAAIDASVPRLKKAVQKMRSEADRTGSLTVYISDSTTDSEDTRISADKARLQTPFEGTAITPEAEVAAQVKKHFGPDSLVPASIDEFPATIQRILERHIAHLKPRE